MFAQADRRARADRWRGRRGVWRGRVRAHSERRAPRAAVHRARLRRAARRLPHPRRPLRHTHVLHLHPFTVWSYYNTYTACCCTWIVNSVALRLSCCLSYSLTVRVCSCARSSRGFASVTDAVGYYHRNPQERANSRPKWLFLTHALPKPAMHSISLLLVLFLIFLPTTRQFLSHIFLMHYPNH